MLTATEHLPTSPERFMTGRVTAADRPVHVLFTKWVGTAWEETSRRLKDTFNYPFILRISLPFQVAGTVK